MDFQSAMETFAEAWAAANTVKSEVANDLSQVSFTSLLIYFMNVSLRGENTIFIILRRHLHSYGIFMDLYYSKWKVIKVL